MIFVVHNFGDKANAFLFINIARGFLLMHDKMWLQIPAFSLDLIQVYISI